MTDAYSEAVKKYTEPGQIFEFKEVTNDKGVTYREFCNPAIPENLRKFFEVDKEHIVAYTLSALAKEQLIETKKAESAIKKFKIDKDRDFPSNL